MFMNRMLLAPELVRREMSELLDNVFNGREARARTFPALNIWEEGDHLFAEAELPGLGMEDIELFVVGSELTIKGQRKPMVEENANYHRRERGVGEFCRTVTLPVEIDADKVEATLKNGVLTVKLPKAEAARPRKISVRSE
ncbi:MAG: molecular chaperone Hsp20 [Phycisphaerae bacterium]|nr:MAG: Hsp20/alpha crystallin family protein [Planctomycetia bacterium]RIK69603.1 MAG: molecular chaperone Hsp20 [Planctomycetota bacterium]GJQ26800.1 MAG: molecular chaperone Hsp20 [Phycisphaerae bacterium]